MPAKNGSVVEAPGGEHMIQCGATLDAPAAGGAEIDDVPPLAAGVDLADAPDEEDGPALAAGVAVVVDVEDDVVAVIAGKLTAPDDPVERLVPVMFGGVAAVCAAPGPASAISSNKPIATNRNSWAMAPSDPNPMSFMRRGTRQSSPAGRLLISYPAWRCS